MKKADTRNLEILDAVVRLNIETGKPVSSGLVARYLRGVCSPATIRAVMKRLTDDGFLMQPHTSAGRLPTDQGYRAFVDRVLSAWPLRRWETSQHLQRMVTADLQQSAGSGSMVKVLATLLSKLTASISIILGPSWSSVRALRLDLYPKEGRRVLMVLVLENAMVRTGQFELDRDYPPVVLEAAGRILSERISGRTVAEIRAGVLVSLSKSDSLANRCASDLATRGRDLFSPVEESEIELEGVANILDEPEFSEPGHLKALIRFLESPSAIRDVLHRLTPPGRDEFAVWIGSENPVGELQSFSLLTAPFDWSGRRGILAVLGPRRMPYQRVFSGIDVLRRSLQLIS